MKPNPAPKSKSSPASGQRELADRVASPSNDNLPDDAIGRLTPPARHKQSPPELFQILVECTDEPQQRDLFDRLKREGLKLRLLVL